MSHANPTDLPARHSSGAGRWLKRLALAVLALVLVLGLVVGGYLWNLRRTVDSNVERQALLPAGTSQTLMVPPNADGNVIGPDGTLLVDDQGQPIDASTLRVDAKGQVVDAKGRPMLVHEGTLLPRMSDDQPGTVLKGVALTRPESAGNSLNFLVIGTDKATGGAARADVIVLAHVSGDRKEVDLIHFPRDLYVDIPGQGKDKINASYAVGGAPLLVQTIQPLVGVPVDHVAVTDFEGFVTMTDAIGGVSLPTDDGPQTMNGKEALRWVRERKTLSQGDISRGQRQMQFIRAVLVKGLSRDVLTNPTKLANFLDAGTSNMVVDESFTTNQMQSIAVSMRDVRGRNIDMLTAPWTSAGPGPGGMSIVNMSQEQMAELSKHLRTDTMDSYKDDVSPKSGFGG
ncbi:LCP family protein [Luteococcus sp. Sow4_B9]|uniref:LCP family protein n=1 Tax=Luteococcus sp. Sow4_B9 TaxID=3438792 RepID=UPI003F9E4FB9